MRVLGATLCVLAVWAAIGGVPSAQGDFDDPIFVYTPKPPPVPTSPIPPPAAYFQGPCGLTVDALGNFYVADHQHDAVDVFNSQTTYLNTQLTPVDPLSGPCGMALNSVGELYVNSYHRFVAHYNPSSYPPSQFDPATFSAGVTVDSSDPTGVAIDRSTNTVYVDGRTYISAYESSGAPVEVAGEPLRIGEGSLEDGYGLAFSQGRLYVPDAGDATVKVYEPAVDPIEPVMVIDGHEVPGGGFTSLRDAAIAVDDVSGKVYVVDNLQPKYVEEPEAAVYVFSAAGSYLGRLKYNVVDALPPGLAVDNSIVGTQGRVYVTSGNSELSSVYAYPPGAETSKALPAAKRLGEAPKGTTLPALGASSRSPQTGGGDSAAAQSGAAATASEVSQKGNLRLSLSGSIAPQRLPRHGAAPVSVAIEWKLATTDGAPVPELRTVRLEINRHGRFDYTGLPTCEVDRIQPASSSRALAACRNALVGEGSFEADISLAGQERYPTKGRLLVFNGKSHGRNVLLGQIYSPRPLATSFVIVFKLEKIGRGTYGTALSATLPKALSSWGNLTSVRMKLSRSYAHAGRRHSYVSAGCPAPDGFSAAVFPLTRASFTFAGGISMSQTLRRSCHLR